MEQSNIDKVLLLSEAYKQLYTGDAKGPFSAMRKIEDLISVLCMRELAEGTGQAAKGNRPAYVLTNGGTSTAPTVAG